MIRALLEKHGKPSLMYSMSRDIAYHTLKIFCANIIHLGSEYVKLKNKMMERKGK